MFRRGHSISFFFATFTAVAVLVAAGPPPASAATTSVNLSAVRAEADWILTAQRTDGAILFHPTGDRVWPYLSNFAATGLARATGVTGDGRYAAAAWRWLDWYAAHMDANGFVTDYAVSGGVLVSTGDMDSTDAYAGTFLLAVQEAYRDTRDITHLRSLAPAVRLAVKAIQATQDVDGLTWAKPSWHVKYEMDQAEAYAGLQAARQIAATIKDQTLANTASGAAGRLSKGFQALWNPTTGAYDWAKHGDGTRVATVWANLYTDAVSQAWPVAFGLVGGSTATGLLAKLDATHPLWDHPLGTDLINGVTSTTGYWEGAALGFLKAGNATRAQAAAANISAATASTGHAWPYTPGDAGLMVVLLSGTPIV